MRALTLPPSASPTAFLSARVTALSIASPDERPAATSTPNPNPRSSYVAQADRSTGAKSPSSSGGSTTSSSAQGAAPRTTVNRRALTECLCPGRHLSKKGVGRGQEGLDQFARESEFGSNRGNRMADPPSAGEGHGGPRERRCWWLGSSGRPYSGEAVFGGTADGGAPRSSDDWLLPWRCGRVSRATRERAA